VRHDTPTNRPKPTLPGPFTLAICAIIAIAFLSGGCAMALTLLATPSQSDRYTELAKLFMDSWKSCVIALLALIAGMGAAGQSQQHRDESDRPRRPPRE
jgi:hypothetical protein